MPKATLVACDSIVYEDMKVSYRNPNLPEEWEKIYEAAISKDEPAIRKLTNEVRRPHFTEMFLNTDS